MKKFVISFVFLLAFVLCTCTNILPENTNTEDPIDGADGAVHVFFFEALSEGECAIDMIYADIGDGEIVRTIAFHALIESGE